MGCTWPLKNYGKVRIILLITLKIRKVFCQKDNLRFGNEKTNLCFHSSFHPLVFFLASLLWTVSVSDSGVKPFHDKGSDRRPSPLFSPPTSTLETRPQGASSSILPPSGLIESCSKCDKYTLLPHVKPYRVPNNYSDLTFDIAIIRLSKWAHDCFIVVRVCFLFEWWQHFPILFWKSCWNESFAYEGEAKKCASGLTETKLTLRLLFQQYAGAGGGPTVVFETEPTSLSQLDSQSWQSETAGKCRFFCKSS